MTGTESRCDATELPVGMCGCKDHRPDLNVQQEANQGGIRGIVAKYPGKCVRCHTWYKAGTYIAHRDQFPDVFGWGHVECMI